MITNVFQKLMRMILDWRYHWRKDGALATCRWLLMSLLILPAQELEYFVLARRLDEAKPAAQARLTLTFEIPALQALDYLQGQIPPSLEHSFREKLAHQRLCSLALCQGQVAAYTWGAPEVDFLIDNVEFPLAPGDIYIDDVYTFPAFRRQGIQSALQIRQLQFFQSLGFTRALAIVAVDNAPSLRLFELLGFERVGSLSFRRVGMHREFNYQGDFQMSPVDREQGVSV